MNNGNRFDLLADKARCTLDRQLRECGGEELVRLEHRLRLFNMMLGLMQEGHILPECVELVECAQSLKDALHQYDLQPVALFRRIDEKA